MLLYVQAIFSIHARDGQTPSRSLPVVSCDLIFRLAGTNDDAWPLMAAEPHARGPHTAIFYHNGWQLEVVSTGPWKPVLPKMYYAVTEPGKDDMPGKHLWTNARQAFYDFHNEIGEQTDVAFEAVATGTPSRKGNRRTL
jgi:hypothetical protein